MFDGFHLPPGPPDLHLDACHHWYHHDLCSSGRRMTTAFFFAISVAWTRNSSLFCATICAFFSFVSCSVVSLSSFFVRDVFLFMTGSSAFLNHNHPKNHQPHHHSLDLIVGFACLTASLTTFAGFFVDDFHQAFVRVRLSLFIGVVFSSPSVGFFFLMTMGAFFAHEVLWDDEARESRNDIDTKKRTKKYQCLTL